MAARKTLLRLSESAWADALIELALCERDLDDGISSSLAAMTTASASEDEGPLSSRKVCVIGGRGEGKGAGGGEGLGTHTIILGVPCNSCLPKASLVVSSVGSARYSLTYCALNLTSRFIYIVLEPYKVKTLLVL